MHARFVEKKNKNKTPTKISLNCFLCLRSLVKIIGGWTKTEAGHYLQYSPRCSSDVLLCSYLRSKECVCAQTVTPTKIIICTSCISCQSSLTIIRHIMPLLSFCPNYQGCVTGNGAAQLNLHVLASKNLDFTNSLWTDVMKTMVHLVYVKWLLNCTLASFGCSVNLLQTSIQSGQKDPRQVVGLVSLLCYYQGQLKT